MSVMTTVSFSNRMRPRAVRSLRSRFTVWRVPPIIAARSDCVYGQARWTSPVAPGSASRASAHEAPGKAPGQIEEVQLLDVAGEAPQLGDEAREQRAPQARLRLDQLVERGTTEDEGLRGLDRRGGGGVRRAVEERELAEEVAPRERGDDRALLALGRREDDLDRPGLDDEQGVTGVALVEDRLAAPEAADAKPLGARSEGLVVDLREQRATPKGIDAEADLHAFRHPGSVLRDQRALQRRQRRLHEAYAEVFRTRGPRMRRARQSVGAAHRQRHRSPVAPRDASRPPHPRASGVRQLFLRKNGRRDSLLSLLLLQVVLDVALAARGGAARQGVVRQELMTLDVVVGLGRRLRVLRLSSLVRRHVPALPCMDSW